MPSMYGMIEGLEPVAVTNEAGESGYARFRIAALVVSPKGTVLEFLEARKGTGRDTDEIDLVLRRSFDHGKTWDAWRVIADDGVRTVNQPTPVVDRDTGTILLPFCKDNLQVFVTKREQAAVGARSRPIPAGLVIPLRDRDLRYDFVEQVSNFRAFWCH